MSIVAKRGANVWKTSAGRRLFSLPALALVLAVGGCSSEEPAQPTFTSVYEPVRTAAAIIALAEKPDATRALLIGEEAQRLEKYMIHAGVRPERTPKGKYDLVVVACREMSRESCQRTMDGYLASHGVLVWLMDVSDTRIGAFRDALRAFVPAAAHLWMPGPDYWVLAGARQERTLKLGALLDLFSRPEAFADLAAAHVTTLPELFANYAGTRTDVEPAFVSAAKSDRVRPAFFLTREVPPLAWITVGDVEDDIAHAVLAEMRSMQLVRRTVVEGDLASVAAKDRKDEEKATDLWARAALRNPNDLFLRARIDTLNRNAHGFLEVGKVLQAMKCFETIVLVTPTDAAAVHNFGMCLKRIGKIDLAEKVLKRAQDLRK